MKKIGIIITSHGKFCLGAVDSLKMIIGGCDDIETVSVTLTSSVQEIEKEIWHHPLVPNLLNAC